MKWFKHDADANRDSKLEKVLMKYGAEGYALYWLCLELIAAPIDKHNLTFELEHDAEILAYRLKMDSKRVEEIMRYFVNLQLFEISSTTRRITCLKLANRLENSIVKNPQLKQIQHLIVTENPGQLRKFLDNSGKVRPDIDIDTDIDIKPKNKSEKKFSDADLEVAKWIFAALRKLNPEHKQPNFDTWAKEIRLMRERDKRSHDQIRDLFAWANQHEFWQPNILSPSKLRMRWDALVLQRKRDEKNTKTGKGACWTDQDWIQRGTAIGKPPRPGESMREYQIRVRHALEEGLPA